MAKTKTTKPPRPNPKRLHLDRRADELLATPAPGANALLETPAPAANGLPRSYAPTDDDLLTTIEVARWLGVSTQWLEIGRCRGYGPIYVRTTPRRVRYRRADIVAFLRARRHASTAEYADAS